MPEIGQTSNPNSKSPSHGRTSTNPKSIRVVTLSAGSSSKSSSPPLDKDSSTEALANSSHSSPDQNPSGAGIKDVHRTVPDETNSPRGQKTQKTTPVSIIGSSTVIATGKQIISLLRSPPAEVHDSEDVVYKGSDVPASARPLESDPDNAGSSGVEAERYQEAATDASNHGSSLDKINKLADAIEMGLNSFSDGAPELIKALDEVARFYPFISVVVVAFKVVCALESSRRYNDRKVLALYVEMRGMITTLVNLRDVKDINVIHSKGQTIKDRLEELSIATAEDTISFANTCEAYSKKKLVVKVFSGPIWEHRLLEFVGLFAQRKQEFTLALSNGNDRLDSAEANDKTAAMELIFRKLASPEQKQVAAFIESKGGRACLKSEFAMQELIDYEARISATQKPELSSHALNAKPLDKPVELRREVDEKPAQATEKNSELFRRKFEIKKRQIEEAMTVRKEGDRVISAVTDPLYGGIIDPDIYIIWKEMNWRGSVKVKHLIISLRDYYSNSINDPPFEDQWTLQYISLSKLQTIVEAVDEEVSGFMTVAQANSFAQARPTFWSLPCWIAYWAVGWQVTAGYYSQKIDRIVARMIHLQTEVRPDNRSAVDQYLHRIWDSIATLTSSLRQSDDSESLRTRFVSYVNAEEDKMRKNLDQVRYKLDGYDAVSVVTGSARIETVILPLLYLLLKRHLAIIKVGRTHVLGTQELPDALQTWFYVARMAALRVSQLQEIFKQQNLDVRARFKTFAHGLFDHVNEFGFVASASMRTMPAPLDHNEEDEIEDPEHVLSYPVRTDDSVYYPPYEQPPIRGPSKVEPETISGLWYCLLYTHSNAFYPMMSFTIFQSATDNSTFSASGEQIIWSEIESYTIQGHTGKVKSRIIDVNFELKYLRDETTITFNGELDSIGGSVQGQWQISDSKHGHFVLRRSPEHLRFRPAPVAILESPARARWRFALNVAHDRAKRNLWSWSFFRGRFQDRRRYVELAQGRTRYDSRLDSADYFDLTTLHQRLHPADIQFYTSLVTSNLKNVSPSNNIFSTHNRIHGMGEHRPRTALTSVGTGEAFLHRHSDTNSDSDFLRLLPELNSSSALERFSHDQSVSLIERAEKVMISPTCNDATRDKCFRLLRRLCGKTGVLPTSCSIQEGLQTVGDHALMSGGFADVWQGVYHGKTVAIKVIRLYKQEDIAKAQKRFCKEVVSWKYLSHPNILRFIGVSSTVLTFRFCMVSDWMENGNVMDYLRHNPSSDRGKFALDVTYGLGYLHSKNVLHGDLKGANILVNDELQACLADFGLATAAQDVHDFSATTSSGHGSLRWMAPELFDPEEFGLQEPVRTKATDVYSLGMVILEIFTGKSPYAEIQTDGRVMRTVLSGVRPPFAVDLGVPEGLWQIMEDCWKQQPTDRPEVSKLIPRIESQRTR